MDTKERTKLVFLIAGFVSIGIGAIVPAAAALVPIGIGVVSGLLVPSTGIVGLTKKRDANGNSIPPRSNTIRPPRGE